MHYPVPAGSPPRVLRRYSVGRRGIGDFASDLTQDPTGFGAAWGQVQNQLTKEGAGPTETLLAQNAFYNSFTNLGAVPQANPQQVLTAATQYALQGTTIAGAVDQVTGLVSMAQSGAPPAALLQGFTGTMMGLAISTGAVTAGVGAAIVGVVSILAEVLQAAGFFGGSPGVSIPGCSNGATFNPAPSFAINCAGAYGAQKSPGDFGWRHFPNPNDSADACWFQAPGQGVVPSNGCYPGVSIIWQPSSQNGGAQLQVAVGNYQNAPALIYSVFPELGQIDVESSFFLRTPFALLPPAVQDFHRSFLSAWKLNQEYALNGLATQPDWAVLYHTLNLWNRAHSNSSTFTLADNNATILWEANNIIAGNVPKGGPLSDNVGATDPIWAPNSGGHAVVINTGPKKSFTLGDTALSSNTATASTTTSTAATVATVGAVVVGGSALALGIWAWHGAAYSAAASHVWNKVKAPFKKRARRNPSLTIAQVQAQLAPLGVVLRKKNEWGEFRVNLRGAPESSAYYTSDLDDALATGLSMVRARLNPTRKKRHELEAFGYQFAYHSGHKALVAPSLDGKNRRMYLTRYLRHAGWKADDDALMVSLPRADGSGLVMATSDRDVKAAAAAAGSMRRAENLIRRT